MCSFINSARLWHVWPTKTQGQSRSDCSAGERSDPLRAIWPSPSFLICQSLCLSFAAPLLHSRSSRAASSGFQNISFVLLSVNLSQCHKSLGRFPVLHSLLLPAPGTNLLIYLRMPYIPTELLKKFLVPSVLACSPVELPA